jgi:hypothetical protein
MVLLVAPLFDLGVDFDVFYTKIMGFLGQISRFEVTVLIKLVTMLMMFMIHELMSQNTLNKLK